MKILILGADGYLGWSMTTSLADDGHQLILVDNYSKRKHMEEIKSNTRKVEVLTGELMFLEFAHPKKQKKRKDKHILIPQEVQSLLKVRKKSLVVKSNVTN